MIKNRNIAPDANIDLTKIAGGAGITSVSGSTFWVDSATGNDKNSGTKTSPVATLANAIGRCTNDKGDVIIVMPGHTETLTGKPSLTINKSSITIIGLGRYSKMPTFLIDAAATAHIRVSAASVRLVNLKFTAGAADIVKAIETQALDCVIENCHFDEKTAGENFKTAISVATADNDSNGCIVRNNTFYQLDAASLHGVWINKDSVNVRIEGNFFQGNYAAGSAVLGCVSTENHTNLLILDNLIDSDADDGVYMIDFRGTNTGLIARNLTGDLDGDGTPVVGTGMSLCENYHTSTASKSATLYPAADS